MSTNSDPAWLPVIGGPYNGRIIYGIEDLPTDSVVVVGNCKGHYRLASTRKAVIYLPLPAPQRKAKV